MCHTPNACDLTDLEFLCILCSISAGTDGKPPPRTRPWAGFGTSFCDAEFFLESGADAPRSANTAETVSMPDRVA